MRGSIVQRKDKQGKPLFYIVARGKWHKLPGDQTKRNAEAYRINLVAEINRGDYLEPAKITFADFFDLYMDLNGHLSPNTLSSYRAYAKNYLLPAFGRRSLRTIAQEDIERWRAKLLREGLAPSTVREALAKVRRLFNKATELGYIHHNPASGVHIPARSASRGGTPLTLDQVRTLLSAATDATRPLYLLALTGGLRMGELMAARWKHLDVDERTYEVAENYVYLKGMKEMKAPKSENSATHVFLPAPTVAELQAHRQRQAAHILATPGYNDQGLIFPRKDGLPQHPSTVIREFKKTLKGAGLPDVRIHDLRHTCAALLIDQGENPKLIQRQMRHGSIQTTFDIYGHLFPEAGPQAMERIGKALGL